ncbi:MAG TPA: hypothetical protein VGN34_05405, partial [Ktedonobacteraceae bacterium]
PFNPILATFGQTTRLLLMKSSTAKETNAIQPHQQLPRKESWLSQADEQAPARGPEKLNAEETVFQGAHRADKKQRTG